MKKFFILPLFILLLLVITGCGKGTSETGNQSASKIQSTETASANQNGNSDDSLKPSAEITADKLEVFYFHSNARCYSCKTVGQYVNETMLNKYDDQLKNGKIDYREINVDLPENKEIAKKFKATGSSLYINRITDGQETIEPDTLVWRLLGDEAKFKKHLEDKINSYLGI